MCSILFLSLSLLARFFGAVENENALLCSIFVCCFILVFFFFLFRCFRRRRPVRRFLLDFFSLSLYIFVTHKILVLLKIIYYYNENELLLSIVKMLQRCIYVIIIGGRVYGREETNETNKCKEDVKI